MMGIDCEILILTNGSEPDIHWMSGFELQPADGVDARDYEGANYYVYSLQRYFGPHYTRGSWPRILYHLIQLMGSTNVKKVWYGGDCGMILTECTPEYIDELTRLYISKKEEA